MLAFYRRISKTPYRTLSAMTSRMFVSDLETANIMSQLNQKMVNTDKAQELIKGPQVDIKDNVMYVTNLKDNIRFLSLININKTTGLCISIEKTMVTALILSKGDTTRFISADDIKIPLSNLGNIIDFSGQLLIDDSCSEPSIPPEWDWKNETIDLIKGLKKAPYKRSLVSNQLYTGHLRIDLNQPMAQNNWILLKGPSTAGKDLVINNMIELFLKEDKDNTRRVVYVTPVYNNSKVRNRLTESQREKLTIVTADNKHYNSTDLYLMPRTALVIAQKLRDNHWNVLLVFDKIIEYDINEKRIFHQAKQPFAPTNIFNEIMENSGDFGKDNGTLTSVFALDTDTVNFNYDQAQTKLQVHLESIVDQIVSFEPELKPMRSYVPKIDLYEFCSTNWDYWQKPLVAAIRKDVEKFSRDLKTSFKQNKLKRELGIQEDQWDNYMYYDSKLLIPLINHREPLTIGEQILLFKFITYPSEKSIDPQLGYNDWISHFSENPEEIKKALFDFANEYDEFNENKTILDIINDHLNHDHSKTSIESWRDQEMEVYQVTEQIERFLKMFHLKINI